MVPGVSFLDCLFSDLGVDPGEHGCQVFEARSFLLRRCLIEPRAHLILSQVALATSGRTFDSSGPDVSRGLRQLSKRLLGMYPADHEVVLYEAAIHPLAQPRAERLRLDQLDTAPVSEISTLWVPPHGGAHPPAIPHETA